MSDWIAPKISSDPRGPRRTIVATEYGHLDNDRSVGDVWFLTLDCGHIAHGVPHFWFEVGKTMHCLECKSRS
jgi:hypothetical protein